MHKNLNYRALNELLNKPRHNNVIFVWALSSV